MILSNLPLNNSNLENELKYARNIGNQLYRTTKLAQKFSYKGIYSIPNISDSWNIEDMGITQIPRNLGYIPNLFEARRFQQDDHNSSRG